MACDASTTIANACVSGVGRESDRVKLLQLIAQSMATQSQSLAPATDVTPSAILSRACTSGIGKVQSEIMLLRVIAQNVCALN